MLVLAPGAAAAPAVASAAPVHQEDCETVPVSASPRGEATTAAAISAIRRGEVTIRAPQQTLDRSQAVAFTFDADGEPYTSVTIPLSGTYSLTSNVTVLFDADDDIVQYSETQVSENDVGKFHVATYLDGDLVSSEDTDLDHVSDAQLQRELDGVTSASSLTADASLQATNTGACLAAVLGVSGIVGGIIAYTCAGACAAAAAGIGVPFCVACVAAYATVGGASITAVASCF